MIEAYATKYGIVVRNKDSYILVTEEGFKKTHPVRINGEEFPGISGISFRVRDVALLAAAKIEAITDTIVFNNKYKQGEEYTGKQLTDYPIEGMIIKRADYHRPFAYVDGEWILLGYDNVFLMQDGQYQVLYVPEDN